MGLTSRQIDGQARLLGRGGDALLEVRPHIAGLTKLEPALLARVGLDARVVVHVGLEVVLLGEGLGADGAGVGLDAGVEAHVQRHVGAVGEGLLADDALEGFLASVDPEVLLEEHLAGEALAAVGTDVRFFASVDADVHVVGDALVEALPAELAAVLLPVPVDLHVGAQVPAVVEVLPALRARGGELLRPLVHRAVVLVVPQLRELFPALDALERFLPRVRPHVNLQQKRIQRIRMMSSPRKVND